MPNGAAGATGLFDSIANVGLGLWDRVSQANTQKETWKREDNAVQRRALDLEAAGMNPILAAGQPAQAGQTLAPQMKDRTAVQAMLQMKSNIAKTRAETDVLNKTKENIDADIKLKTGKTKEVKLSNELNEILNPLRVKGQEWDNENRRLQTQLNRLGVGLKEMDIVIRQIDKTYREQELTLIEKKILAQDLLNEQIRVDTQFTEQDRERYQESGIVRGQGKDINLALLAVEALKQWEAEQGKIDKTKKGWRYEGRTDVR